MSFLSDLLDGKQSQPSTYSENGTVLHKESDKYGHMDQTTPTPLGGLYIDDAGQPHFGLGSREKANDTRNARGW